MPTDIAENGKNKLFLSVHYYTPGDFCLENGGGDYTVADQEATKKYFQELKKFSDAGYAVIIGECGVCNPSSVTGSVTQWFYDTFTEAAKYHAVPVLWETGALFDRTNLKLNYKDIAIFLNTINGTNGDTSAERETGGAAPSTNVTAAEVPDYLDGILWGTSGIHAYISYQTATWDYRNAYLPQRTLSNNAHSWEYIQAAGNEVTSSTKVTDVHITADGEYTIAIDGIDLSGANSFKMLSVATDIEKSLYSDITVTDTIIKIDGEAVTDAPVNLIAKSDDKYYNFMLVNVYGKDEYPLADLNENEKLKMPAKSMEITFKINGLSKALADIESGEYINQETGKKISDTSTDEPEDTDNKTEEVTRLKKGATFTSGNYKYKVTKAATASTDGTVALTGLSKKGLQANKLTVPATATGSDDEYYTINSIGKKAFSGANATSITLNKKIKEIPSQAFAKCKKLTSLTLKAKLSKAAKDAFKGCTKNITVKGTSKKANKNLLNKTSYKNFK